jgi:serine protease Do
MKSIRYLIPLVLFVWAASSFAAAVKDRETAVRDDKKTMENDQRWIYGDFQKGFAEAKRTGKPLLVVLRCVPCLSCAGIDASVLTEPELVPLLDQFVCVRVINANALDMSLFQFDYDLSFSTLFFNGDGTVYGRYGSWTHQKDPQDKTTVGYKRALEAALALHRGYPANKASLAGKQGGPSEYKTPIQMPLLQGNYQLELNWNDKVLQSCVHCHQIGDALRFSYRDKKEPIPTTLIYPWPTPETIGLTLAPDHIARVVSVAAESSAAKAGFKVGDDLVSFAGQPLISIADFSWALHRAPDAGSVAAVVNRNGTRQTINLSLPSEWRRRSDISRRVGTSPMRGMATGGLRMQDLSDTERGLRAIGQSEMALLITGVGQYNKHAAGKNAGFQKDDVILQIAGLSNRLTESELIGHLLQKHPMGERVKATVLRGTDRLELLLPMQ